VSLKEEAGAMDSSDGFGSISAPKTAMQKELEAKRLAALGKEEGRAAAKGVKRREKEEKEAAREAEREEAEWARERSMLSATASAAGRTGANTSQRACDIRLVDVTVSVAGKVLLEDASCLILLGHKYGLIGRNGTGKTTLLRHLAAKALPGISAGTTILHVEQEVEADERSALECVLQADVVRSGLLAKVAEVEARGDSSSAEDAAVLAELYEGLNGIDADSAPARAAAILSGLQFDVDMQGKKTKAFSGGWRMRLALARALFVQPDVLLLDEPTNHLDLHAVLWLEQYLVSYPGTLLIVSHARDFLNGICTDMVHLHRHKLHQYKGNYDSFEKTRAERLLNQQKAFENSEAKREHIQEFIDKFRYNAKRSTLVQSRIKALARMAEVEAVEDDGEYHFTFPDPGSVRGTVLNFQDVAFGYSPAGPPLLQGLNLSIDDRSRVALVGANGTGKSTLLKLITGDLAPTSGWITRSGQVRYAMFGQHHVESLDLRRSPLAVMVERFGEHHKEDALRSHLAGFGVTADLGKRPIRVLSGGQKCRVALALMTFTKPHVLLLDEPSNHLDIDSVDALIDGLSSFEGAVLMVSHDGWLIEGVAKELWNCEGGTIDVFKGEFDDYKRRLVKEINS